MRSILTIAGSDSSGGAGIQDQKYSPVDLKQFLSKFDNGETFQIDGIGSGAASGTDIKSINHQNTIEPITEEIYENFSPDA